MGRMYFEGWKVVINDFTSLNASPEVKRLGLVFSRNADLTEAEALGNVSTYLCILSEVKRHIVSGAFNVELTLSTGKMRKIYLSSNVATEDGKDIFRLL